MSEKKMNFDSIEAAIEDLKNGIPVSGCSTMRTG